MITQVGRLSLMVSALQGVLSIAWPTYSHTTWTPYLGLRVGKAFHPAACDSTSQHICTRIRSNALQLNAPCRTSSVNAVHARRLACTAYNRYTFAHEPEQLVLRRRQRVALAKCRQF